MSLPDYILRRYVHAGGVRLPKRELLESEIAGTCPKCSKVVVWKKMLSGRQVDGRWWRGDYFHFGCATPDEESDFATWQNGWLSRRERAEAGIIVPKGNLEPEEYRYWVGSDLAPADSRWALCRCCRTSTYGKDQRIAHFRDPDFMVGGDQCSTRLVNAYKKMAGITICLVCKQDRKGKEKWGVPLCGSPTCEKAWKFAQDRYISIELELRRQKAAAEFEENRKKGKIVKAFIDCGDKPTSRPYCEACRMFADNEAHYECHRQKVIRGEIHAD